MNWLNGQIIKWEEPLRFAARFADAEMALLYSGMQDQASGTTSYLALEPFETAHGSNWHEIAALLARATDDELPDYLGYLGYGLREESTRAEAPVIALPEYRLVRYRQLFRFDHVAQTVTHYYRAGAPCTIPPHSSPTHSAQVEALRSNISRAGYEQSVRETLAQIRSGNFYQANITRKFFGSFDKAPATLALFTALATQSPAAYSAYIRHGGSAILSASPECFLSIRPDGSITTRPIKGSARRSADGAEDEAIRQSLLASDKNRAENLMIVDLMRNDLARVSIPESVTVPSQSQLHSYVTIHHLISTIRARKHPDKTVTDVIRACFPPGSMTGAPKIAAMRWCSAQEPMERGVYSGAIGWLNRQACELSVVIRTLLVEGRTFEFQVGGGIVADSTPHEEWQETLTKARGICAALGIAEETLAGL